MITYRKSEQIRLERRADPEPPFFCSTLISAYAPKRDAPVAVDYFNLTSTAPERSDTIVCHDVERALGDELERRPFTAPLLIDATGFAESLFGAGEAAAQFCSGQNLATLVLVSSAGSLPAPDGSTALAIACWPDDLGDLERLFQQAGDEGRFWGAFIPIIDPVTTSLGTLERLAASAARHGAAFLASAPIDSDPSALRSLAERSDVAEEEYERIFHTNPESLLVATERHIAALASEHGLIDHVILPESFENENWRAAAMLSRCGARRIRMDGEDEIGWSILRSARIIAHLTKPLAQVSSAASLSIVGDLELPAVDALEEWLATGRAHFIDEVDARWRLRRDHGAGG
ncbi:MAG TPA: hypothetical protein VMT00_02010 [Thermoanaerobaculia bacterium]|nr:hypothetical protein [Thermoanaerobaculia bacterium]